MKIRRVGAYGVCRDAEGRVLLARGSDAGEFPGVWSLPGGGVEQGEHPDATVVREFEEETGFLVRVSGLRAVLADVTWLPRFAAFEHTDRIIYDIEPYGGNLRSEVQGSTDLVDWAGPAELDCWPLMPFTSRILGLPVFEPAAASLPTLEPAAASPPVFEPAAASLPVFEPAGATSDSAPKSETDVPAARVQRFGAYAVATDPAGRMLLTRIAPGYPGAGRWHLPGGGTDHGETPEEGLARELIEETAQAGRVTDLLEISHRHTAAALGPEGVPIDWHVVRVLYRVQVEAPTEPVVTEAAGGSTEAAGWFSAEQAEKLSLTEIARSALRRLAIERAHR